MHSDKPAGKSRDQGDLGFIDRNRDTPRSARRGNGPRLPPSQNVPRLPGVSSDTPRRLATPLTLPYPLATLRRSPVVRAGVVPSEGLIR